MRWILYNYKISMLYALGTCVICIQAYIAVQANLVWMVIGNL